jgi:phosphoribosylanthranilate isomerase
MKNAVKYGEIKSKRNIFPGEAKKIADKGNVGILIVQAAVSERTKSILADAGITLYETVRPDEVNQIRKRVKVEKNRQIRAGSKRRRDNNA